MKKVLIITYYWPPAGGVPVQRWVKMVRYLRHFGWEPVIYTVENGEHAVLDHSLEATLPANLQVIRRPIWEPYDWYRNLLGLKKGEKINAAFLQENKNPGILQELAIWVRGNFFIPDARKFWIRPSVRFLTEHLRRHPVDAIISTGPPHSMHLIAMGVKRALHIPWIADFRDPWTKIDYYTELHLSKWADKKHHALEQKVALAANTVVTVSPDWAANFNRLNNGNTVVITNGFDEEDFPDIPVVPDMKFSIHHVGMINKARNPAVLWQALSELCAEISGFKNHLLISFTGKNDHSVQEMLSTYALTENSAYYGQVDHPVAIRHMRSAAVLLLLVNDAQDIKGRIPAKLFEYLAACRPVIGIGDPEGDAAHILQATQAGIMIGLSDKQGLKNIVSQYYTAWKENRLVVSPQNIQQYSRRRLAGAYAQLLDAL